MLGRGLHTVEDFRQRARRHLPRAIFDFIDGGAGAELTLRANRAAFDRLELVPRVLTGAENPDLSTTICGIPVETPLVLAPVGAGGLAHPDGELGACAIAARRGMLAMLSCGATYTAGEIAAAVSPMPFFQLLPLRDRSLFDRLVARAARLGFRGLCVTVDAAAPGKRERDLANGLAPLRLRGWNTIGSLTHPRWALGIARHRRVVENGLAAERLRPRLWSLLREAERAGREFGELMTSGYTWSDVQQVREAWRGPMAIKGVLSADDAKRAVEVGADAVIVSNHGGRQLDGVMASIEALPSIVDAVGQRAEVLLDGGVRRGVDVAKALSLGARACMIGRPWVYGLAAGGSAGIDAVIRLLEEEIALTVTLLGRTAVTDLDRSCVTLAADIEPAPGPHNATRTRHARFDST
jgi:L-lactate dehydrogenase (cytochrome)